MCVKLRARKGLPGSSPQLGNSAGQSLAKAMLSPHRAARAISITSPRLAEAAGCTVLSCCPLVVLENAEPSQFPLLSRAESEQGTSLEQDSQHKRPGHSPSQIAVKLAVQQQNSSQSQAFSPKRGFL